MPEMIRKNERARPSLPERTAGPLSVRTLTPPISPAQPDALRRERRNLAARAELLRRIEVEYHEMPGLSLTVPQAQKLFGLRSSDICVRVLATLVDRAILRRDPNGAYIVNGHRP
jgi:hypothetical protein